MKNVKIISCRSYRRFFVWLQALSIARGLLFIASHEIKRQKNLTKWKTLYFYRNNIKNIHV